MSKAKIINIFTVKFVGLGWLLEVINVAFKKLDKNKNYKIRIILLDEIGVSHLKNSIKFFLLNNRKKLSFLNLKKLNYGSQFNPKSIDSKLLLRKKIKFNFKNFNFEIFYHRGSFLFNVFLRLYSFIVASFNFLKIIIFSKKKIF